MNVGMCRTQKKSFVGEIWHPYTPEQMHLTLRYSNRERALSQFRSRLIRLISYFAHKFLLAQISGIGHN